MFEDLTVETVDADREIVKAILREAGVAAKVLRAVETRALRTGRRVTGQHATNRDTRWSRPADHPQYGTELNCKIIAVKLFVQLFCFNNAPRLDRELRDRLGKLYLGHPIRPGSYHDTLLLEPFDFGELVREGLEPRHGHSGFHMGHEDPTRVPKHAPDNINWRSMRSNLIQGDMTLRAARIYFVKLIARYFELGELEIR